MPLFLPQIRFPFSDRPVLLVLLVSRALALAPAAAMPSPSSRAQTQLSATYKLGENDPNDISIPYDAAARLAYDGWCQTYGKPFDAKRYETFKANYEALTIANVKAAKEARDAGLAEPPKKLDLNEYADMTAEEYMAMQSGGGGGASASASASGTGTTTAVAPASAPKEKKSETEKVASSGDVLGQAVEAAELQNDASAALAEAADALAEEEEVRLLLDSCCSVRMYVS